MALAPLLRRKGCYFANWLLVSPPGIDSCLCNPDWDLRVDLIGSAKDAFTAVFKENGALSPNVATGDETEIATSPSLGQTA